MTTPRRRLHELDELGRPRAPRDEGCRPCLSRSLTPAQLELLADLLALLLELELRLRRCAARHGEQI